MYTAAGHVLTINGANKTASVRMDGLDLAVLTEEDGRRRLQDLNPSTNGKKDLKGRLKSVFTPSLSGFTLHTSPSFPEFPGDFI